MTDSATQPNSKMAKCPFCGEEINVEAIKCRYCGEFIDQYAVKKTREECKEVALDKPVGEQSTWRKFCMLDTRRNKQKLILVITGMIVLFIGFYIHEHGGIPWINRKTVSIDSLQKGCVRLINEEIHTRICENYGKDWIPIHV